MPNLSLVVCGAPLAQRTEALMTALENDGWVVTPMITSAASVWLGSSMGTGRFRVPGEAKPPVADAIVVCPMTFNTGNKWAAGIADTSVLSVLCEALGGGRRIVAVPFFKDTLWAHPAWASSLLRLQDCGVRLVDPTDGGSAARPIASGTGEAITRAFDPAWVVSALRS